MKSSRKDRRNVQLLAIATADVETGYVFGMHLNFDGKMDPDLVAADMLRYGDDRLPQPFRRYARIWLPKDYERERRPRSPKERAEAELKAAEAALEAAIHVTDAEKRFAAAALANPSLSENEVELMLMKREMAAAKEIGHWRDRWVAHPLPKMTEPDKRVCWLTDLGDYDDDHAARLFLKATLHPVDRFFMQVRRRLSLAERPIATASKNRRIWHG